ncbi:hypothetical protein ACFUCV_03840 [Specibacter sp. NPDC057265]|uniref:hypothetical protein n=1 Tax=Specibacter sp. NPDC057265 TaxID=3346075 RepID=UPI00363E00DE
MPFPPAVKSAASTLPTRHRPASAGEPIAIPVLPAVEVQSGAVTFMTPGRFHQYWSAEASELNAALDQAVRAAQWMPQIGTLVVTVAQTGVRSGRRIGFRLAAR